MPPIVRNSLTVAVFVAAAVASYAGGVAVGRTQSKASADAVLASVQADLGLTHLMRLRELESDLSRGCTTEALEKIRFDTHSEMYKLVYLYKEHKHTWVVESIEKRDPTMPSQLEQFRKKYDSWTEPKCTK